MLNIHLITFTLILSFCQRPRLYHRVAFVHYIGPSFLGKSKVYMHSTLRVGDKDALRLLLT